MLFSAKRLLVAAAVVVSVVFLHNSFSNDTAPSFVNEEVPAADSARKLARALREGRAEASTLLSLPEHRWTSTVCVQAAYDSVRASLYEGTLPSRRNTTIPVWGLIVTRIDFALMLQNLIAIDVGVGEFVFVVNGRGKVPRVFVRALQLLFPGRVHARENDHNGGVSAGWNVIVRHGFEPSAASGFRTTRRQPVSFVVISNADIIPFPLLLGRFAEYTSQRASFLVVNRFHNFACFAYTLHGWRELGYFDETIYPAYGEDVEIHLRAVSKGLGLQSGPFGNWDGTAASRRGHHVHSPNRVHDKSVSEGVARFPLSHYIQQKWGINMSGVFDYQFQKPFLWPFNRPRISHSNSWIVDPQQRACLMGGSGLDTVCHFRESLLSQIETA